MKRICFAAFLLFLVHASMSQVTYYKGEWRVPDKTDLFTCICKIDIQKGAAVEAEFIWIFKAIDSTNEEMMKMYEGKQGKKGIEFTKGTYNPATGDIYLEATQLRDPDVILGMAKYFLKLSANKKTVYGTTKNIVGDEPGVFYAVRMKSSGSKEFEMLKKSVKE